MPSAVPPAEHHHRLAGFRLVSLWTLASRILGFARDSAMAAAFGLGDVLGAFVLAFRIPNLARSLFGEGALTTAFLPIYIAERQQHGEEAARRLATAVFVRLLALLSLIVGLGELGLLAIRHWGRLSDYSLRLIDLLAIMTPYLLLICLAALCSAVLQAHRRFGWPAVIPVLLNLWWLAAVGLSAWLTGDLEWRIRIIAGALLIGGALQLGCPALVLWRGGHSPAADFRQAAAPARAVFYAILPTVLAAVISQFNTVLDTLLAWVAAAPAVAALSPRGAWVDSGTTAALYFAQRLYQFPLGLIGVTVGTVLYPTLAAHAAANDYERLRDDLTHGLCAALSIAVPASAGLALLSGPMTAALFQHGRFDEGDALLTSRITAIYVSVVWAAVALLLVQRGYFSVGDRITPLKTSLVAAAVNLALAPLGLWLAGGTGLAAATALTTVFQLGLALALLKRHVVALDWRTLQSRLGKTVVATATMTAACLALRGLAWPAPARLWALLAPITAGAFIFLAVSWVIGLEEPWEILFRRRVWPKHAIDRGRASPVPPAADDPR